MGTEYALVHDETGEAFDLGRGSFYLWSQSKVLPHSLEAVEAHFAEWLADVYWKPKDVARWTARVSAAVWAFIQAHPGCRVVSDLGDDFWAKEVGSLDRAFFDRCFVQVASRHDFDDEEGGS